MLKHFLLTVAFASWHLTASDSTLEQNAIADDDLTSARYLSDSDREERKEETCSNDRCDAAGTNSNDWSAFDSNAEAQEIVSRLAPYESLCNVDRRSIEGLSFKEFLHRYAYNEPVILVGASDNDKLRTLTTRQRLLGDYGKSVVRLSTANTHSYDKGEYQE